LLGIPLGEPPPVIPPGDPRRASPKGIPGGSPTLNQPTTCLLSGNRRAQGIPPGLPHTMSQYNAIVPRKCLRGI
jgi:hypothetical protein